MPQSQFGMTANCAWASRRCEQQRNDTGSIAQMRCAALDLCMGFCVSTFELHLSFKGICLYDYIVLELRNNEIQTQQS